MQILLSVTILLEINKYESLQDVQKEYKEYLLQVRFILSVFAFSAILNLLDSEKFL